MCCRSEGLEDPGEAKGGAQLHGVPMPLPSIRKAAFRQLVFEMHDNVIDLLSWAAVSVNQT